MEEGMSSDGPLHAAACRLARDSQVFLNDAIKSSNDRVWTVCGKPIDALRKCAFSPDAAAALQQWRLGGGEHRLEHSNHKLGQGSYAQVFQGQVRISSVCHLSSGTHPLALLA
jgi:hypothetical protein